MAPAHRLANRLRQHRLAADGMTQEELARRIGVTRQTVHSIEKGRYRPSVELALLLAAVFEVPVEALFFISNGEDTDHG